MSDLTLEGVIKFVLFCCGGLIAFTDIASELFPTTKSRLLCALVGLVGVGLLYYFALVGLRIQGYILAIIAMFVIIPDLKGKF